MIVLEPLLPWPLLAFLAIAATIVLSPSLLVGHPGAWPRAGAAAALALLLAGPAWERRVPAEGQDVVLLVRDRTPSSEIPERAEAIATAADAAARRLAGIPGIEVRRLDVSDDPAARIVEAIGAVPAGRLSAVVLVSDGQIRPPADGALPGGAPVHLLLPGQAGQIDRRVRFLAPPAYAIVGRPLEIEAVVEDLGSQGAGAPIEIRIQGTANGVERRSVRPGVPFKIPLAPDRAGALLVGIDAPPLPGEAGTANNHAAIAIPVIRDRLRVLLLSGEAHPGTRAWRRLLRGDPAVDLVHLTILRTLDQGDAARAQDVSLIPFPTRELFEERLQSFDLVILDRFRNLPGLLLPAHVERLARRIQEGGALLAVFGPEAAGEHAIAVGPLAQAIPLVTGPLVETSFVPRLAAGAAAHPILRGIEGTDRWGPWGRHVAGTAPEGARTLLVTPGGAALLTLANVGEGRAAALASDHLWWWGRGHEGGGPDAEISRRLVHWLLREPDLEEQDLRLVREGGAWRVVRRDAVDTPAGLVEAESPDGQVRRLTLVPTGAGTAEAVLDAPVAGLWRLRHGSLERPAIVTDSDPQETADLRADPGPSAAWRRGGGHAWTGTAGALPNFRRTAPDAPQAGLGWLGLPRTGLRREARIQTPLPPVLPALIAAGLVFLAWRREAR